MVVIKLTEEITRLIEEINGILNNESYMPKTMLEVEKNHKVVECLNKAIVELTSAISDEPTQIALDYQNSDNAIDIIYE
jgi:hypothetical protein